MNDRHRFERTRYIVSWEHKTVAAPTAEDDASSYTETTNLYQECETISEADNLVEKLLSQNSPPTFISIDEVKTKRIFAEEN